MFVPVKWDLLWLDKCMILYVSTLVYLISRANRPTDTGAPLPVQLIHLTVYFHADYWKGTLIAMRDVEMLELVDCLLKKVRTDSHGLSKRSQKSEIRRNHNREVANDALYQCSLPSPRGILDQVHELFQMIYESLSSPAHVTMGARGRLIRKPTMTRENDKKVYYKIPLFNYM